MAKHKKRFKPYGLTRDVGQRIIANKADWGWVSWWEHLGCWSPAAAQLVCETLLRKIGYRDEDELNVFFADMPEELDLFYHRADFEIDLSLDHVIVLRKLKPGMDQHGNPDDSCDGTFRRGFAYWPATCRYLIVQRDKYENIRLVRILKGARADEYFSGDLTDMGHEIASQAESKIRAHKREVERSEKEWKETLRYIQNLGRIDREQGWLKPR